MTSREEREKHLDWLYRLKSNLKIFIPKEFHLEQFEESLDYAISSIKTDLKYDLLYENEPIITLDELKEIREEIRFETDRRTAMLCEEDVLVILDKKISELEGKE